MKTEKEQRIYYQDIVYHVCYALDLIDGKKPGHGIVCGSADEPNNNIFDRMRELVKSMKPKYMRAGNVVHQSDIDVINNIVYEIVNPGNKKSGAYLYLGRKQIRALSIIYSSDPLKIKDDKFYGFSIIVVEKEDWCKLLA